MLVKYYGLIDDESGNGLIPRFQFLINGKFRFTQPKYLNDKGSESKLLPYFNRFSPSDLKWAKRQHDKWQADPDYVPSDEELINMHLRPSGIRLDDCFPTMILTEKNFDSVSDFEEHKFKSMVSSVNTLILDALSSQIGVLSLSNTATNELMWTHYASEGKGIAISFNEAHPFFTKHIPLPVTYKSEDRACITYFEGNWRINGEPVESYQTSEKSSAIEAYTQMLSNGVDIDELTKRLMFSKAHKWAYEDETRIVLPLELCDEKLGPIIKLPEEISSLNVKLLNLGNYPEVCLKRIPFDAFDTLFFGYNLDNVHKEKIIKAVKNNKELSHLKIKSVKHDIYGEIELVEAFI
ncbi:hypothetical protein BS333_17425 [Vibrio azureus]|uniref:DUF2971 domain-containing protein n=1 Tax=Vibrio azureus NBRC 104587 TaxID=1219077 RepID=U3A4P1_9VIBR|nr:DUF2971 domain-containing protein [Vibrio azureus]AUI88140.1 hypothetical protein BS333_17425 [Vibrio azureus]GAD74966.1 hypothetical protein VAZ01S_017_00610 [Vibrio azureus NBRC 104587]